MNNYQQKIPKEVIFCLETLGNKGFEAFLVGGCVRDLILNKKPRDWDIATNAQPEEIIKLFKKTVYTNDFGTVSIINEEIADPSIRNIEITPYRQEGSYSDFRHPDSISFSNKIEEDLQRRDFTINAIAYNPQQKQIIDLYKGQKDIKDKIIRTVGDPEDRFNEDPLRMMRAIRLMSELDFTISNETLTAIEKMAHLLEKISMERIRDEFIRIIMSEKPDMGLMFLVKTKMNQKWLPELETMMNVEQNKNHIYDVWEHSIRSLRHAAENNWELEIRLAAFFHDIGKPATKKYDQDKKDWTFYSHEVVGARIAKKILRRLKFPVKTIEKTEKLIICHMFFSDIEKITLSAVRRIISKVGQENIWDLMKIRSCDRIGMGRPKENPYRLRKYHSMIEEALRQPTSVAMLKISGKRIMEITNLSPGPKIGNILNALLAEILKNPKLNNEEYLEKKVKKLSQLKEDELRELAEKGKEAQEIKEGREIKKIRDKYWVK